METLISIIMLSIIIVVKKKTDGRKCEIEGIKWKIIQTYTFRVHSIKIVSTMVKRERCSNLHFFSVIQKRPFQFSKLFINMNNSKIAKVWLAPCLIRALLIPEKTFFFCNYYFLAIGIKSTNAPAPRSKCN